LGKALRNEVLFCPKTVSKASCVVWSAL
jgi:hypothetical protein